MRRPLSSSDLQLAHDIAKLHHRLEEYPNPGIRARLVKLRFSAMRHHGSSQALLRAAGLPRPR